MMWFWVSRELLDEVKADRDYLREQLGARNDHLTRVARKGAGMPELPRQQEEEVEPMPNEVREMIRGFADPTVQATLMEDAYRARRIGESWDAIREQLAEDLT